MNDIQLHTEALLANPCDKVSALALADHVEEEFGLTRYAALRYVCRIRRAYFKLESGIAANALFTPVSRSYRTVRATCSDWLYAHALDVLSAVVIRAGYATPMHSHWIAPTHTVNRASPGTMYVSAYWLLKRHRPALYRHLITRRLWRTAIVAGVKCRPWGKGVQWTGVLQCWPGEEQLDQVGEQYLADLRDRPSRRAPESL